jgi:hypothetical protein
MTAPVACLVTRPEPCRPGRQACGYETGGQDDPGHHRPRAAFCGQGAVRRQREARLQVPGVGAGQYTQGMPYFALAVTVMVPPVVDEGEGVDDCVPPLAPEASLRPAGTAVTVEPSSTST